MEFRTEINPTPSSFKIDHHSRILTMGSCFAEVIGNKLQDYKFRVLTNPFGTIFNPLSLNLLLSSALKSKLLPENSWIFTRGMWFNYHIHSSIYAPLKEQLQKTVQNRLEAVAGFLKNADFMILTLGTAFVYELKDSKETVANCHKLHPSNFIKKLLTPQEIHNSSELLIRNIQKHNPNLKIIITVSPVRHIKDTLELNSVSKSVLRLAAHSLQAEVPNVEYFPAYELLLDDLRDYRFYKEDLIHPNQQAETYIWEKFAVRYFSENTRKLNREWMNLKKGLEHKPMQPGSNEHKIFLEKTLEKIKALSQDIPLEKEIQYLKAEIARL